MIDLIETLASPPVLAVLSLNNPNMVEPVFEACIEGGLVNFELTLRHPTAPDSLRLAKRLFPDCHIGAGTVLNPEQAKQARDAGADFALAPGCSEKVIEACAELNLPFIPGIANPSDIERALQYHLRVLKFFPAHQAGGHEYLKAISTPYQHLGIKYIPLGGLSASNFSDYLHLPQVLTVGGSWIAKANDRDELDPETIYKNAQQALTLASQVRS